jgi:hypothetical protein
MFGRRRRSAPIIQAPLPDLSDERILDVLHEALAEVIGVHGEWTLVPRRDEDTDVIFHGMKAEQLASMLAGVVTAERAAVRGERPGEPSALPWTPSPITIWAEPERPNVEVPDDLPAAEVSAAEARMVA